MGLALLAAGQGAMAATTTTIYDFPTTTPQGTWAVTGQSGAATISTVEVPGAPLGVGAGKLTTTGASDQAQVALVGDFGKVSDITWSQFSISYSFLAQAGGPSPSAFPAPALKLEFLNGGGSGINRGYTTLVFEAYNNGFPGGVPQGSWQSLTLDQNSQVWATGGFGSNGTMGGAPQVKQTLTQWIAALTASSGANDTNGTIPDFAGATLFRIGIGLGSGNPNQTGYFDNVTISGLGGDPVTYDFEPTPEPSTLALGAIAAGLFGVQALRRRRAARV
jgi:hypothetical protein